MGRAPCCDKANVKKGPWSPEEDAKLKSYIEQHGTGGNWIALPQKIGLKRCGKSCRLRWLNYLRPNIKHGGFTEEEDRIICGLYVSIGSRWSIIAAQLPGRTDNDIKNYWNTRLKKKLFGKQRKETEAGRSRSLKQDIINKREIRSAGIHDQINPMLIQDGHINSNNKAKATFWPELPVLAPMAYGNQDPNSNQHYTSSSSSNSLLLSKIEEQMSTNIHQNPVPHEISTSTDEYMSTQQYYVEGFENNSEILQGQSNFAAEIESLYGSDLEFSSLVNYPFTSNCGNYTEQGQLQDHHQYCHFSDLRYLGVQ